MHLTEVAFKGNRKEFFHWSGEEPLPVNAPVIVDADRGEDLGTVHAVGDAAQHRFAGVAHGEKAGSVAKQVRRLATDEEHARAHELTEADQDARRRAAERVRAHNLVMKVTDAEWQWDRRKLTLYFTAEKRVDFRALVRDLASTFRTRIELKQIGVRDEARRLDGIGRCGRQYCSASWLPELRPVNLAVAKDQRLSLNPLQISGACGRLMCCLRYEHEFYVQSRKRFPKEGRILVTVRGEEKVIANDIFNDRVTLRDGEGELRVVALADLRRELPGAAPAESASGGAAGGDGGGGASVAGRAERALAVHQPGRPARSSRPEPAAPRTRPERRQRERPPVIVEEEAPDDELPAASEQLVQARESQELDDRGESPDAAADAEARAGERRRRRRGRRGGRRARGSARDGHQREGPPNDGPPRDGSISADDRTDRAAGDRTSAPEPD